MACPDTTHYLLPTLPIERSLSIILRLLVLSLPFVRVLLLPVVDAKLQPTELIFLLLAPLALWHYGWSLWPRDRSLQWGIVVYLAANGIAAISAGEVPALLEALGRIYLVLLALIVGRWVAEKPQERRDKTLRYFLYGTAVLALFTYVGYFRAVAGDLNSMVQVYGNYPYLGTVLRAKGFTAGAGMLIIVLLLPLLYAWNQWRRGKLRIWWFILLFPLAILTFAKEVLLLGLGLLLVEPIVQRFSSGRGRWVQGGLIGAVAVIFWLGTHFIVQERQPFAASSLAGTNYTAGHVVWQGDDYQVIATSYTELKKAGVAVARQHPWLGVGPGQFGRALPAEKEAGRYPANLPDYDPHSTWVGAWAETGVFGFAGLILLFLAFGRRTLALLPTTSQVVPVFLLLILIMSVSKDVMNFRFLWLALGLVLGLSPGVFSSGNLKTAK